MDWNNLFESIAKKDYYQKLSSFLDEEYKNNTIYPKRSDMFNAFKYTPLDNVKVVIFGQDPYHEIGQAMGLAFSVPDGIKAPPSLINIFKEIENEFNEKFTNYNGDLTYLAKQGVLLLNTVLTVREHEPLSHNIKEYKLLINDILKELDNIDQPIVFLLWGNNAKKYAKNITNPNHLILEATHPSPLGANKGGWFGCDNFKNANKFLIKNQLKPINWIK